MENIYLKTDNEYWQQPGYLMEGIREALYYGSYKPFGKKLWDLTVWVASRLAELPDEALVDR